MGPVRSRFSVWKAARDCTLRPVMVLVDNPVTIEDCTSGRTYGLHQSIQRYDMNLVQSTNSNLNLSIDTENLTKCDGVKYGGNWILR